MKLITIFATLNTYHYNNAVFKQIIISFSLFVVCAQAHAADENLPQVETSSTQSLTDRVSGKVQEVILNALSLTGIQYKYGGNSPETGFDCSGYVRYVFKQALNLTLPHNARAMSQIGTQIAQSQLKPGDLVFFNTLKNKFSHVGIYVGDDHFVHSPSAGKQVKVVSIKESYWASRYSGAVRLEHLDDVKIDSLESTMTDEPNSLLAIDQSKIK